MPNGAEEKVQTEEIEVEGESLVARVKEIIREGNARRIIIKNEKGKTLIEVPLTLGVAGGVLGAVFAPLLVAIGAIGALIARCSIIVERVDK